MVRKSLVLSGSCKVAETESKAGNSREGWRGGSRQVMKPFKPCSEVGAYPEGSRVSGSLHKQGNPKADTSVCWYSIGKDEAQTSHSLWAQGGRGGRQGAIAKSTTEGDQFLCRLYVYSIPSTQIHSSSVEKTQGQE